MSFEYHAKEFKLSFNKGFVQDFQNTKSDRKSMFKNMTLNVGDRLERKDC